MQPRNREDNLYYGENAVKGWTSNNQIAYEQSFWRKDTIFWKEIVYLLAKTIAFPRNLHSNHLSVQQSEPIKSLYIY